jgi:hypothetical protein
MIRVRNTSGIILLSVATLLIVVAASLLIRSKSRFHNTPPLTNSPKPDLAYLSILKSDQLLAKVGSVELRSGDLRDALQLEFHGQMFHSSMSPQDLSLKIATALDKLIGDELLAQEARKQGFETIAQGAQTRQDLARQLLKAEVAKLSAVSDREMRLFYKNHGEKFLIPPGVQVRELFLPHQGDKDKKDKRERAYRLGEELVERLKRRESVEELAKLYVPQTYHDKARGYLFKGSVMDSADEQKILGLRPGELAGPFRVEGGYSVFQGIAQVRGGRIPFYQAQEKIKVYLQAREEDETRKSLVEKLQQNISVQRFDPDTLVAIVH